MWRFFPLLSCVWKCLPFIFSLSYENSFRYYASLIKILLIENGVELKSPPLGGTA